MLLFRRGPGVVPHLNGEAPGTLGVSDAELAPPTGRSQLGPRQAGSAGAPYGRRDLLVHAAGKEAAVDCEYLAVYEACSLRSQEDSGTHELFDFAEAPERRAQP